MYDKHSIQNSKIKKRKKNRKEKNNDVYSFNKLIYLVLAT